MTLTSAQLNSEEHTTFAETDASNDREHDTPKPFPLTSQQIDDKIYTFINSVNKTAVCEIVSEHYGGKTCRIIDQKSGSFNICFFVRCDATDVTLVLRIPIDPVTYNAWDKLVSEVTAMR